jgi:nicotinate phosphoribosyltransferase
VISFGARRIHPVVAPMVERNAFIGGCDGVSVVKNAEFIGEEPAGTMPHALILAYGVGTSITNARVIDFAMDIIEIDGKPLAKRGKMSASKSVLGCSKCFQDKMVPFKKNRRRSILGADRCSCGGRFKELLIPFIQGRKILWDLPKPQAIREYVLEQLPHYDL